MLSASFDTNRCTTRIHAPNNRDSLSTIGEIYEKQGEFDKAINFYRKAVVVKPKNPWKHARRGLQRLNSWSLNKKENPN